MTWRAAAVLVLVTAAVITSSGCRAPSPAAPPAITTTPALSAATMSPAPASPDAVPPAALEEARISGSAGEVRWELAARTVEVDAGQGQATLSRVTAWFYERGTLVVTLQAPRAVYRTATRDIILSGGVRARAPGRALDAQRVEWVARRRVIVATGAVRFVQEQMTVRADRLESDLALRTTRLLGNIRVTVQEDR